MVFLEKEPGFEKIQDIFLSAVEKDNPLLMTSVNYGEVLYIILRECGQERTDEVERSVRTMPIEIIAVDIDLAREAAHFKAFKKLSFADCFAAALARQQKAELITGDKEFRALEGSINIHWI